MQKFQSKMSNLNSFIAVSSDFENLKDELKSLYPNQRFIEFIKDDFLTEDAKAVIKEAFIAEKETKILLLGARNYNLYAQNSLLKVLEEPPLHVMFILCVPTKTALLPTIRSRLPLKVFNREKTLIKTGLNFANLSLSDIFNFLSDKKYLPKEELLVLLQSITTEAISQGVNFSEKELDTFAKLLQLAALNSRSSTLLSTQLLIILKKVS